ncbi:MAG: prepilin-type N-terminal cleavage/methylation domain-containing protein [Kiritimatiellales bacterium]
MACRENQYNAGNGRFDLDRPQWFLENKLYGSHYFKKQFFAMKTQASKMQQGFTLVEMMIALTVGALAAIVILYSFGSLSTSLKATEHLRNMHYGARHAIDIIGKDIIRGANVSACVSSNNLTMTVMRSDASTVPVVYNLSGNSLSRSENSQTAVTLATGVNKVTFTLYDTEGVVTAAPASAYFVDVKMEMKTQGVRNTYTDELQTRTRMRVKSCGS